MSRLIQNISKIRAWVAVTQTCIMAGFLVIIGYSFLVLLPETAEREQNNFWRDAVNAGHAEVIEKDGYVKYQWLAPVDAYQSKINHLEDSSALRETYLEQLEKKAAELEAQSLGLADYAEKQTLLIDKQKARIEELEEFLQNTLKPSVEAEPRAEYEPVEPVRETAEPVEPVTREEEADEQKKKWYQFWKKSSNTRKRGR